MNRGQAPQRPPNLGPNQPQSINNAFRTPYNPSGYTMTLPRQVPGVLQGYPGSSVPTHSLQSRQQQQQQQQQQPGGQSVLGGPSPGLFGGRSAVGGFPFGIGLMQHQQQQTGGQQGSSGLLPHLQQHPSSAQQQQQPSSQSASPQPPIQQSHQHSHQQPFQSQDNASNAPSSTTNAQETGLDPNEFPALGSGAGVNGVATGGSSGTGQTPIIPPNLPSSYASQAGTGVPLTSGATSAGTTGGAPGLSNNSSSVNREFSPEDFPALGGHVHTHPHGGHGSVGVNGFPSDRSRVGGIYGSDESRKFSLKTTNQTWSSSPNPPNANTTSTNATTTTNSTAGDSAPFSSGMLTNGTSATTATHPVSNSGPNSLGSIPPISSSIFNGTNPLSLAATAATTGSAAISAPTGPAPGLGGPSPNVNPSDFTNPNPISNGLNGIPQTPAQQVLMSPADRWGLLGLLALIRSTDPEVTLLGIGTDLGTMGLDMQSQGNLYSAFITPWSDSSAAHLVEPDFQLPACYNVQPAALTPNKAAAFSDETLFFMFYAHPRDMLQELAAQELWNRNWRYHKELRVWLTKETGTSPSQKQPGGETGMFTIWDSENWEKTKKRLQVAYSDLEEKTNPVFPAGIAIGMQGQGQTPGQAPGQSQGTQGQGVPSQRESGTTPVGTPGGIPVGRFAGMGMSVGA